jgi:hypothetical protein
MSHIFDGDMEAMKIDSTVWLIHPHLMNIVCRLIFAHGIRHPVFHDPDRCLYSPPSHMMNLVWAYVVLSGDQTLSF